jgi:aspartate aminotransferase-like enzyme
VLKTISNVRHSEIVQKLIDKALISASGTGLGMRRKLVMIPGPTNVPDRVMHAMLKPIINHRSPAFTQLYNGIKEKCQKVFLTKSDIIVFTASGSGGVEAAITNIVRPGG